MELIFKSKASVNNKKGHDGFTIAEINNQLNRIYVHSLTKSPIPVLVFSKIMNKGRTQRVYPWQHDYTSILTS